MAKTALLRPLLLALLALTPGCAVGLVAVGAGIGAWVLAENSDDTGEMRLAHSPERVYQAALAVCRNRGAQDLKEVPASRRIECELDEADVVIQVFTVPGAENSAILKISARSTLRGRAELAQALAEEIRDSLAP